MRVKRILTSIDRQESVSERVCTTRGVGVKEDRLHETGEP